MPSVLDSQHQHLETTGFTLGLREPENGIQGWVCGRARLPVKCSDSSHWAKLCGNVCDVRAHTYTLTQATSSVTTESENWLCFTLNGYNLKKSTGRHPNKAKCADPLSRSLTEKGLMPPNLMAPESLRRMR